MAIFVNFYLHMVTFTIGLLREICGFSVKVAIFVNFCLHFVGAGENPALCVVIIPSLKSTIRSVAA